MNRGHGSPYDRGGADAYYWRQPEPHKYPNGTGVPPKILLTDPEEIAEYMLGYREMPERKDWD